MTSISHDRPLKPRTILLTCFALALSVRLLVIFVITGGTLLGDENRFWHRAINIVDHGNMWGPGGGYASDMPLMPLLMAGVYALGGSPLTGKLVAACIGALAVFPTGLLARRLTDSNTATACAGLWAALYPYHVYFSTLILSEPLFLVLMPAFFLSVLNMVPDSELRASAKPGAVAGLAHLTRPTMLYFLPVAMLWAWLVRKVRSRQLIMAAVVFLALCAPWVARNWSVFGTPILTTTGSGQVLWEGNNPWNEDGGVSRPGWGYLEGMPSDLDPFRNELVRDAWKKQKAVEYITSDPAHFLAMSWKKFLRFWSPIPNATSITSTKIRLVALVSCGPVFLLALMSLWTLRDRFRDTSLLWLFIGYYTALHMALIGSVRYRLPMDTLLIALAAATAARLFRRRPRA